MRHCHRIINKAAHLRQSWLPGVAFFFLCLAASPLRSQDVLSFHSSELRVEGEVKDVVIADMNGDSLSDLVLLYRPAKKGTTDPIETGRGDVRTYDIPSLCAAAFLQDAGTGFTRAKPGRIIAFPRETIAYVVGNYSPGPGDEIVIIDERGAQLLRPPEDTGETKAERIIEAPIFFLKPRTGEPFSWLWPEDLDGDGHSDLILPVQNGYCVYLQGAEGGFDRRRYELVVPVTARLEGSAMDKLSFERTISLPCVGDFDGDAREDLLFLAGKNLLVFLQRSEGGFSSSPSLELAGDFHRSRKGLGRIVNVALWTADVNKDGRTDVVAFVSEGALTELEAVTSSVLLFLGRGREGYRETPDAIINMQGMLVSQWVGDFNGDRRADLMVASVKTDLAHSIVKHIAREMVVEYVIHLCDPASGVFTASPSYRGQERLPVEGNVSGRLAQFHADIDGDGMTDRVGVREKEGKRFIQVRRGKVGAGPNSLAFEKKPMIEQEIGLQGQLRLADVNGDGRCDVLLVKPSSVEALVTAK